MVQNIAKRSKDVALSWQQYTDEPGGTYWENIHLDLAWW